MSPPSNVRRKSFPIKNTLFCRQTRRREDGIATSSGGLSFGCLEYRFLEDQHPGEVRVPAVSAGSQVV